MREHPFPRHCKHCEHENGFMPGMLFGLLVGGVLGVLFAPESGEKTRKKLKETTADLKEKGEVVLEKTEQLVEDVRIAADPLVSELERRVTPLLRRARESGGDVQSKVLEKIEQLVDEAEDNSKDLKKDTKRFFKNINR